MEHDEVKKNVRNAAFQTYDQALRAYQDALRIPPDHWKTFTDELSKFVTGKTPHELVFENADREAVRRMPDDLVKTAIALAQANGAHATRLVLPKRLKKIPDWLSNFTGLKKLQIESDFVDSYISVQNVPHLDELRVCQRPIALTEIEVSGSCHVVCEGYERCQEAPLKKFGRLLTVCRYTEGKVTLEIYRTTGKTSDASFNLVDLGMDPDEDLNSTGICGYITQVWLEERSSYRRAKADYLAWREWGEPEIEEKYASRDGKKFQFRYREFAEFIRQKSASQKELNEFRIAVSSRRIKLGDAPTYVFRLSKIGEFLALVFEKMRLEGNRFHHMRLDCIHHSMGLEFSIQERAKYEAIFKVVYFDSNKTTRHSISRASSLQEVRAWKGTQLTGRFLDPLVVVANHPESKHFFVEKDPVFYSVGLEALSGYVFNNGLGMPNINFVQMENVCTLEGLFFMLYGRDSLAKHQSWKHQAMRSINSLNDASLEKKIDLIEGRTVHSEEAECFTTLRMAPNVLLQYVEVMQTLGLRGLDLADAVADSLLYRSVRPHRPMHALMIQSSAEGVKPRMALRILVDAVKLLRLPKKDIVKFFCPEHIALITSGSAHKLSAMCMALSSDAIDGFFEGLQALGESNLIGDDGMDEILDFHLSTQEMWNTAREHALSSNARIGIAWLPLLLSELHWGQKSKVKILKLIGFPCRSSTEESGPFMRVDEFLDGWTHWLIDLSSALSHQRAERVRLLIKALAGVGDNISLETACEQAVMRRHAIVVSALVKVVRKLSMQTSTSSDIFLVPSLIKEILNGFYRGFTAESFKIVNRFSSQILDDLCALTLQKSIDQGTMCDIWNAFDFAVEDEQQRCAENEKMGKLKISLELINLSYLRQKPSSH